MNGRFNRLVCIVWLLLCCGHSIQVSASDIYRPVDVDTVRRDLNWFKIESRYHFEKAVTDNTNPFGTMPKNKAVTIVTGKETLGNIARNAKRGSALDLAVVAAVASAGWAIDELTKQVTVPVEIPSSGSDVPIDGFRWDSGVLSFHDTAVEAATAQAEARGGSLSGTDAITQETSTRYKMRFYYTASDGRSMASSVSAYPCPSLCSYDAPTEIEYQPVPDADFDEEILPKLGTVPAHSWDEALKDTAGRPKMTPELRDALGDWYEELADRDPYLTYDPSTGKFTYNPPPDENGLPSDPIDYDSSPDVPNEDEWNDTRPGDDWPGFCDWATVVCDWIEWTKEEPEDLEPEVIPVDQIDLNSFKKDYHSGLGGGSCPAAKSFSFGGQSFSYSFEPACTAASYIRPLLIAAAGVIASLIIAGSSRGAL